MGDRTGVDWLRSMPACRVRELYRPPVSAEATQSGDAGFRQRLAGLVAAFHAATATRPSPERSVLVGWRRVHGDGPIDVYVGGAAAAPSPDGDVVLTLPAGGRGRGMTGAELVAAFGEIPYWTRVAGINDGLLVEDTAARPRSQPRQPSLEDCLLRAWRQPFAWLLLAVPVPPADIATQAGGVAEQERDARTRTAPQYQVRAARLDHRHRELSQAHSTGLWHVHLLAAGGTPAAAASVAGLLVASANLVDLPYALVPVDGAADLDGTLATLGTPAWSLPGDASWPFAASTALVAALAREPAEEIPGLRFTLRSTFDVTPEPSADPDPPIAVGQVLDRNDAPVDAVGIARGSLNRHTFVCGATGAGKSQTIRALLTGVSGAGLPWLVVEPAKAEYRLMASRLGPGSVIAIRPGAPDAVPAGINPLRPAAGFPLQTHIDLVRALFAAAFDAEEPFPQVLSAALTRCYEELGWDLALGESTNPAVRPRYPTLLDLQRAAERVVADIGYGAEVTANVLGFVRVRIASLRLGTTGRFFEGGHPIDFTALMRHNVVFEIEDVGDDRDKAFLMGTVLIQLVEHLRVRQRGEPVRAVRLRHLSVFEEAHRLLRRGQRFGQAAHALELFASLLAEIRAYGEGLVIAEQIPSKLVADVIKNTAVKIVHRLPAMDDRQAVGATMNLTADQSQYLVTLRPGVGALFTDGMDFPVLLRMPDGTATEAAVAPVLRPAVEVVGRRSDTCGTACRAEPCTLRQMRAAQRLLELEPWLPVWAELSVLAHLTGWEMPVPHRPLADTANRLLLRTVECAVSHAVDAAVAARSAAIAAAVSPSDLAAHVTAAMLTRLDGYGYCAAEEPEWLAAPYRWSLVDNALARRARDDPAAGRHERSREWEQRYGRPIPGETCAEQLDAVRSWFTADIDDRAACRTVAFGVDPDSVLEKALRTSRRADTWPARLAAMLDRFDRSDWPRWYLAERTAGPDGR